MLGLTRRALMIAAAVAVPVSLMAVPQPAAAESVLRVVPHGI